MNLLIDTDILIYFLKGDKKIRGLFLSNSRFYYSYITRKELLKKPGLATAEEEAVMRLLNRLRQVPIDERIASLAEQMVKRYRHRKLTIPDSLIAATALTRHLTLVTFNRKHFNYLPGLSLFPVDTLF